MAKKKKSLTQGKKQSQDIKKNISSVESSKVSEQKKQEPTGVRSKPQSSGKVAEFAFGRENYKFLLIGLAFIIVGFVLMVGGGSDDPNEFSYDIFNFRRLTLAPILVLIGYAIEIYAIMKKPKD
jgi:hypothetical protein